MSRKRRFVNRNSGGKFEEIFDAFVVAKTAKGVSDITIRNYHQNLHNISLHFDISMPFEDLKKEHLDQMVVSMRKAGFDYTFRSKRICSSLSKYRNSRSKKYLE